MAKEITIGNTTITVVAKYERNQFLTEEDKEMDKRAKGAVKAALSKAKVCNIPIAKYDDKNEQAYLEYPDGRRVNV